MMNMQVCIEKEPEFVFVEGMPLLKRETPREKLFERIDELVADGFTKAQIAARIGGSVPVRTVEAWVQHRKSPADWVCELLLEKLK